MFELIDYLIVLLHTTLFDACREGDKNVADLLEDGGELCDICANALKYAFNFINFIFCW